MSSRSQFSLAFFRPFGVLWKTVRELVMAVNASSPSKPRNPFSQASTMTGTEWLPIMQNDSRPKYGMTGR